MVVPTPIDSIPPYVRAVTFLEPKGDKVAEVAARVATLRRRRSSVQRLSIVAALAVAAFALVALLLGLWRSDKVVLVDSEARRHVLDEMELILQNIGSLKIEERPIQSDWLWQADKIAKMSPSIIVIHFHALRSDKTEHYQSEVDLLLGLSKIRAVEPDVWFVLFSSGFTHNDSDNKKQILEAVERICRGAPGERADMEKVVARVRTTPWTEKPSGIEKKALSDLIVELRR